MEEEKDISIDDFSKICSKNAENINEWDLPWEEDNVSNELAYFFQDESIFKAFLRSVLNFNNKYCRNTKKVFELTEQIIEDLKFKKMCFPKRQVKIKTELGKKIIDILIEGTNFICLIENKFGSSEHDDQCIDYKKYVLKRCEEEEKIPICIFLDLKHSKKSVKVEDFIKPESNYNGYYLAYYDDNILPIFENIENKNICSNIPCDDITKFCNFLREACWLSFENIKKEKTNRKKRICNILRKVYEDKKIKSESNSDEILMNGTVIMDRAKYLELSLLDAKTIKSILEKMYRNF